MVNFIVIGGQRSGTTSLFHFLSQHPQIHLPQQKEVHYFDRKFHKGVEWYHNHFNNFLEKNKTFGEISPNYIINPHCPTRVFEYNPKVKLIVLLRNPVDRAYSHYMGKKIMGIEASNTFEEAINLENKRVSIEIKKIKADPAYYSTEFRNFTYTYRGFYFFHLTQWWQTFSDSRLLILKSESLFSRPAEIMNKVYDFLEITRKQTIDYTPKGIGQFSHGKYPPLNNSIKDTLFNLYSDDMQKLSQKLGSEFIWKD